MLSGKKIAGLGLAAVLCMAAFAGCGNTNNAGTGTGTSAGGEGNTSGSDLSGKMISVVSREDGSGTRDAFTELMKISEKDANGETVDNTTVDAEITNSTSVMMTTVAGNTAAIGYISLGSLNDTVKALNVDGVEATAANVKDGSYSVSRPFNIVTKDGISEAAQDFVNYILSADGQAVVEAEGYVAVSEGEAYTASGLSGKITVAGSSSVTPVMESLSEAYMKVNPDMTVEVEQSDSTTGVTSTIDGICDIGMASRELKDSETSQGVKSTTIAKDGIAIIVNVSNSLTDIKPDMVKSIYTGDVTEWDEVLA